jgi:hypothetical protein
VQKQAVDGVEPGENENVEVGQGAEGETPGECAAAERAVPAALGDGGAEGCLGDRIHGRRRDSSGKQAQTEKWLQAAMSAIFGK